MTKKYLLNLLQTWGVRLAALLALGVVLALYLQTAWNLALVPLNVPVCSFAQALGLVMFLALILGAFFLLKETQ